MKAEKEQLIHDLLDDAVRHDGTLLAGARILRRRRLWRGTKQFGIVALAAVAVTLWFERNRSAPSIAENPATRPSPTAVTETRVKALTDDELLALFPNTPVALATLSDGRKLLIFPRAEDQQRFMKPL